MTGREDRSTRLPERYAVLSERFARRESRPEDLARIAELETDVAREREIVRQVQVSKHRAARRAGGR